MSNSALSKNIIALNDKVKADSGDSSAGYLSDKVDGSTIKVNSSLHQLEALGWEIVSSVDVSSNCTYVDFTGLDGNSAWFYKLFVSIKNPTSSFSHYHLFVEEDYTETNYYVQYIAGYGSSMSADRPNIPIAFQADANNSGIANVFIVRDSNGYFKWISSTIRTTGANVRLDMWGGSKTATITNITSLRVQADTSNAIGSGSKLILFKVKRN